MTHREEQGPHNSQQHQAQAREQLAQLRQILDEQVTVYSQVESRIVEKQQVIIEGDPNKLVNLDQQLIGLGQTLTRLEQDRMTLLGEMGHPEATLNQVLQTVPTEEARPLRETRSKLVRIIENIKAENDQAEALLKLSVRWVESTVELIANALVPEAATYNSKGAVNNRVIQEETGPMAPSTIQRDA